jgi:DNA-binding response OmpR family regulator
MICEICRREIESNPPDPAWFDLNRLMIAGKRISRHQAIIVRVLWRRSPMTMTFDTLLEALYGDNESALPADEAYALRAHISRLRKRLAPTPYRIIATRGIGYRLERAR